MIRGAAQFVQARAFSTGSSKSLLKYAKYIIPYSCLALTGICLKSPFIAVGVVGMSIVHIWASKYKVKLPEDVHYTTWTVDKDRVKREKIDMSVKEFIAKSHDLKKYIWDKQSIKWGNSGLRNFHYREKGYFHSEEVRSERYIYAAAFEDKVMGTKGEVHGLAVFFSNTEGYVEKLSVEVFWPQRATIKLIELEDEDIERIIPEVQVKFNQKAYMEDVMREIYEYKERERMGLNENFKRGVNK